MLRYVYSTYTSPYKRLQKSPLSHTRCVAFIRADASRLVNNLWTSSNNTLHRPWPWALPVAHPKLRKRTGKTQWVGVNMGSDHCDHAPLWSFTYRYISCVELRLTIGVRVAPRGCIASGHFPAAAWPRPIVLNAPSVCKRLVGGSLWWFPPSKVAVLENVKGFRVVAEKVAKLIEKNCPGHSGKYYLLHPIDTNSFPGSQKLSLSLESQEFFSGTWLVVITFYSYIWAYLSVYLYV